MLQWRQMLRGESRPEAWEVWIEMPEETIREVFTQFGVAYFHSEVLHRELCIISALVTFEKIEDVTRPRVEETLTHAFSLTLGQIVEKTKGLFPSDLQQQLEVALDRRNYLAHRFWFERNHLMFSEQGLLKLRQELIEITKLFSDLDEATTEYFMPKFRMMGLTDELLQERLSRIIAGQPSEPLMSQRRPKKQERVVRAWDVKVGDNSIAQVFETEDGCLWQFCDEGLGWSCFKRPAQDWIINETLQEYLPANINPRPAIIAPWNYEFKLAKGVVLWVKPGRREKSYKWGIKVSPNSLTTPPNPATF